MPRKYLLAVLSPLCFLVLFLSLSQAAPPPGTATPAPAPAADQSGEALTPEAIQAKIVDLDRQIKISQEAATAQNASQLGVDLSLLQKRTELLQDLREVYDWLEKNLVREKGLVKEKADLLKTLAAQQERGVTAPPPYSLSFYEDLLSQVQFSRQRQETYALSSSLSQEYLALHNREKETAAKKVRLLQDQLASAANPAAAKKLTIELELAKSEKELADIGFLQGRSYAHIFKLLQEMAAAQADLYQEQAVWVRQHLQTNAADLEKQQSLLKQKEDLLEKKRAELEQLLQDRLAIWKRDDQAAVRAGTPVPAEVFQERSALKHTYQSALDNLVHQLIILRSEEELWKDRLAVLKGQASQKQLLAWREDLEKGLERWKRYFQFLGEQQVYSQAQLAAMERRLADPGLAPGVKAILMDHQRAYDVLLRQINGAVQTLTGYEQLSGRLSQEIESRLVQDPRGAFLTKLQVSWQYFLNFEIWVIEGQPVTVKKFLDALLFLVIGLFLAKVVLHYGIFPLLKRTVWRRTQAEILQKGVTYLAYTIVFLITLAKLRVPLQSFATLGGGIAIGLGFAAQTIIKNFVSGFIILGEKPFGIGDLVEVGGILGNVHDIGSRSTLLRTGESKDLLVPNSFFLENTITNWTRRDRLVRAEVTVGVAYGSPVAKVKELLQQAVDESNLVLKSPAPVVIFNDFAESSLVFVVYFWIEMANVMGRRLVQSNLRFKIDELFQGAGIIISFPQRDIHLDSPLEVRLVNNQPT